MTNPTSSFGWVMPSATDLVTDLPADFEVFGQAVDTDFAGLLGGTTGQVLAKASGTDLDFVWSADAAGMTNPMTTTADIIYSSSGSTPARLGIGSTGDLLTVAGGVPTWAAPAGSLSDYTLLGSAAMTAASTITVSGISGIGKIFIYVAAASCVSSGQNLTIQFNADSGANYSYGGITTDNSTTQRFGQAGAGSVNFSDFGNNAADVISGYMIVEGCGSTGIKPYTYASFAGGTAAGTKCGTGYYSGTSAVTSVSALAGSNFDAGTIYIYGA